MNCWDFSTSYGLTEFSVVCLTIWWQRHKLENWCHQLHDLPFVTLVLCHDWSTWFKTHAYNPVESILSPKFDFMHSALCLWWMTINQEILLWKYILLSDRDITVAPWKEVAFCKWSAATSNQRLEFCVLTCIVSTTNLKTGRILEKYSAHVAKWFDHTQHTSKTKQVINNYGGCWPYIIHLVYEFYTKSVSNTTINS